MAKANYINHDGGIAVLHVVKDNKDGTVDLALTPKGEAVVTRCEVLVAEKPGCCMLLSDKKAADADSQKAAGKAAEEAAAKAAEEEAAKAAAAAGAK